MGESLARVERYDFNRIVTVKAEVDKSVTSGDDVLALLEEEYFPDFRAKYPEVSISLSGNAEERRKSNASLKQGFLLSIILIYILLAIPLKSYVRPLVIMSVIPFGIVGALMGHYIIGIPVSILSVFGILALSGIVVNDSLVLSYRISELEDLHEDADYAEMLVRAGGERFRAILLTTLTTFVGLVPLLFEPSVQAQFLKPMAVSVGFGVLFATVITLVLLPVLLMILRDIHGFVSNGRGKLGQRCPSFLRGRDKGLYLERTDSWLLAGELPFGLSRVLPALRPPPPEFIGGQSLKRRMGFSRKCQLNRPKVIAMAMTKGTVEGVWKYPSSSRTLMARQWKM